MFISDPNGKVVASFPGYESSWSPDGTRVATWDVHSATVDIYDLDGVREASLALPSGYSMSGDNAPRWSPDESTIAVNIGGPSAPCCAGRWELRLDGGAPRQIPGDDPRSTWMPAFSPDGMQIAFVTETDRRLVVSNVDGSQPRDLTEPEANQVEGSVAGPWYPMWSPGGDRIAFVWSRPETGLDALPDDLRVVDLAPSQVTTVIAGRPDVSLLSWSPNGDRLLLDLGSLWSVKSDGSDLRLLVAGTGAGDWQWLPADAMEPALVGLAIGPARRSRRPSVTRRCRLTLHCQDAPPRARPIEFERRGCVVSSSRRTMARSRRARNRSPSHAQIEEVERVTGFEPATFCLGSPDLVSVVA
jgi:Tol biopolymer transport system component